MALIGLVIGAIAKFLTPRSAAKRRDPGGCIMTMIVGLVGSAIGVAVARTLNISTTTDAMWFVMSVLGAIILLLLYHLVIGTRNEP